MICAATTSLDQTTVTRSEISGLFVLTCLLFCVCVANKCFSLRESWREVANYCSGRLVSPRCAPPAASAGLETHLNIDQAPGRAAWGPGPLACSRALLIGTEPSCQYHSSTWTLVCVCVCVGSFVYSVCVSLYCGTLLFKCLFSIFFANSFIL